MRQTPAAGGRTPGAPAAGRGPRPAGGGPGRLGYHAHVSVAEHVYEVPDEEELARLVGSATPHFALQIRDRVALAAAALPPGDPRREPLAAQIARLERLAVEGAVGADPHPDLPARPSLEGAEGGRRAAG